MALTKQPVSLNFQKGLQTKADPYQLQLGNFLSLVNSVFTTEGRLTKRAGFPLLTTLPENNATTLTTLSDNLIATGSTLQTYSRASDQWIDKGSIQPIDLSVKSLVRNSSSQVSPDIAISESGLCCLVYEDDGRGYYQISDSVTGQQVVSRQALVATSKSVRVSILGTYFIVTYMATIAGNPHLQFVAIPIANPTAPGSATDLSTAVASINAGYDVSVANNTLYAAWGGSGGVVRVVYMDLTLTPSASVSIASSAADLMSVCIDMDAYRVWVAFWDTTSDDGYAAAFDLQLSPIVAKTQIINNTSLHSMTAIVRNNILQVFYQVENTYTFSTARTDYINRVSINLSAVVSTPSTILRSVGLASKPFISNGIIYMLAVYGDKFQPDAADDSNESTYFLIDQSGNVYMRLAATNAGGYAESQVLSNVYVINGVISMAYQITSFLAAVNKGTDLPAGTPVNAIYTQTGINLASFSLDNTKQRSSEIAQSLHLTGGQLWQFDGVTPVEHGFQVYPENMLVEESSDPGSIANGTYYYVGVYEWTDNQGLLHRSAPSIPQQIVISGGPKAVDVHFPTLRLTYKLDPNPVRLVIYRWSVAQQVYYQITSVTAPILNDTSVDSITYTDTKSDAQILGQTILYTTGGVLENIAAPSFKDTALFDNRLWGVDSEDPNLLWYSKQVIEGVPVEMSDLLTRYVSPTTGAEGSTGEIKCISAMDDKLIIYKPDALYYINGQGPDNAGANNAYSEAIFITGVVGSTNPSSIALIPAGSMFQSNKGIWLLKRDLSYTYIGAPVEAYNNLRVTSAVVVPGTTQVRFTLDDQKTTLMYDYYFDQWAVHTNTLAISSTIYMGTHCYLNSRGQVLQETPGVYTDLSSPVLMSFTTSWINVAGVQGFERFYFANLLGTYHSPFKLNVQLAYDYNSSAVQNIIVTPDNYTKTWGDEALWGSGPAWGGPGNVFRARFFPKQQKCQNFQVTVNEVFDPAYGVSPGQGLSISGLLMVIGAKRGWRTQKASRSFG